MEPKICIKIEWGGEKKEKRASTVLTMHLCYYALYILYIQEAKIRKMFSLYAQCLHSAQPRARKIFTVFQL